MDTSNKEFVKENKLRNVHIVDLLSDEFIALDVEAKDKFEAIMVGCGILEKKGFVTSEYCRLIIESLIKNGPYFVIAPHFALSHAKNEGGSVKKLGMSLVRLKTPVYFGNKDNDPVSLIITLATPDDKSHIQALQELSEILMDSRAWEVLNNGSKKQILDFINAYITEKGRSYGREKGA